MSNSAVLAQPSLGKSLALVFVVAVAVVVFGEATALAQEEDPPAEPPEPPEHLEPPEPTAHVSASVVDGVSVTAPAAAGFTANLQLATWARFDLVVPEDGEVTDSFSVPLVRPLLTASAFDGLLRVLVQPELAGPVGPLLLDLHLDLVLDPALIIRVGQFRTPYSRAYITPIVQLSMIGRGLVSDSFRSGRDTGIMIFGKAGNAFEYAIGIFDGAGIGDLFGNTPTPMPMGRVVLTPYGSVPYDQSPSLGSPHPHGLALGLGAYYSDRDLAGQADPSMVQRTASAGGDLSIVEGRFTFFAEGYYRERSIDGGSWFGSWGGFAQAGLFLAPQVLELDVRAGLIDSDTTADTGYVQSYEASLKGYLRLGGVAYGHHASLGLHYQYLDIPTPYGPLGAGVAHRLTAQLQIWI